MKEKKYVVTITPKPMILEYDCCTSKREIRELALECWYDAGIESLNFSVDIEEVK